MIDMSDRAEKGEAERDTALARVAVMEHLVGCARVIIGPGHRSWHKDAGAALKDGAV